MNAPGLKTSDSLRVFDSILDAIGKTPLVHLNRIGRSLPCPLYAKLKSFNPGGSVKDRTALNMIVEAERAGRLKPGGTVVEATSGNTGVGMVTEVDLLKHMLERDHTHCTGETIEPIVQAAQATYPAHTSLQEVLPNIVSGNVIIVTEGDRPVGILTKIDVLDFISQEI